MLKKIMVAYDEGQVAARALDKAIELAKASSGEIFIVAAYMTDDNPSRPAKLEKLLAEAASKVAAAGIPVTKILKLGGKILGETLCEATQELKADVIVMGSSNRSAIGEFMFGSVSKYVLRHSAYPVMIIK